MFAADLSIVEPLKAQLLDALLEYGKSSTSPRCRCRFLAMLRSEGLQCLAPSDIGSMGSMA